MNELQNFDFEGKGVRTIQSNLVTWFAATDVTTVLGIQNTTQAVQKLDGDERSMFNIGRQGEVNFISEPGLYKMIGSSRKPAAKRFNRWVTHEVLPSIRKHGMYATDELVNNPDLLIQVATQLKQERAGRLIAEQRVNELKPKADYYDKILANKGVVTINSIAKNYGMSAAKMNQLLHELGVQYKQSTTWLLYSKYQAKGYTHIVPVQFKHKDGRDDVNPQTKWTQKGHIFIYELLKANDILPMIEQIKEEH